MWRSMIVLHGGLYGMVMLTINVVLFVILLHEIRLLYPLLLTSEPEVMLDGCILVHLLYRVSELEHQMLEIIAE